MTHRQIRTAIPSLVPQHGTMEIGHNVTSVGSDIVGVRGDIVGIRGNVVGVGNRCMGIYHKLSLKDGRLERQQKRGYNAH